jgi:osomolarity two-component system response regulator SSK1
LASLESPSVEDFARPTPDFSTLLLRRLLRQIGASLTPNLEPNLPSRRSYELTVILERGSPLNAKTPIPNCPNEPDYEEYGDFFANEPSLEDLNQFAEQLRGRKVTLYASSKSSFAHHLTSYLTSWGLDVSHVSPDSGPDAEAPSDGSQLPETNFSPDLSMTLPSSKESISPGKDDGASPLSFVLIDDDVNVLRDRLNEFRLEHNLHRVRKRPSLSVHQRPQSSAQTSRNPGQTRHSSLPSSVMIMHFTSLVNYKLLKDLVESILIPGTMPEVMIIPKPAGPRRFLTALHTAVTKPPVDPFFIPTATCPSSRAHTESHFYSSMPRPSTPRPPASRSDSDRSPKEPYAETPSNVSPPSVGVSASREYFSETKLGSSPSSGLVIQSSDGQPAGIFFHPRAKSGQVLSTSFSIERDKGQSLPFFQNEPVSPRVSERKSPEASKLNAEPGNISLSAPTSPALAPFTLMTGTLSVSSRSKKSNTPKPTSPQQEISLGSAPRSPTIAPLRELKLVEPITQQRGASEETPINGGAIISLPGSSQRPTRRSHQESKMTPSSRKGKSPTDANVVPPINVLIVDGMSRSFSRAIKFSHSNR